MEDLKGNAYIAHTANTLPCFFFLFFLLVNQQSYNFLQKNYEKKKEGIFLLFSLRKKPSNRQNKKNKKEQTVTKTGDNCRIITFDLSQKTKKKKPETKIPFKVKNTCT